MRFLLIIILLCFAAPAHAEEPPIPRSKKEHIGSYEQRIAEEKNKKASLEEKAEAQEKELNDTRKSLIEAAKNVQNNEKALQDLDYKITALEDKRDTLSSSLEQDRADLARLLLALQRLRRVPPEAIIAKPGAPLKTAQTALLMKDLIPIINRQAESLREKLESLEQTEKTLQEKKQTAQEKAKEYEAEHKRLAGLMAKREKLYENTHADLKERQENVKRISAQARNLQDLVTKLDQAPKQTPYREEQTPLARAGQTQLPVSGIIRVRYNDTDAFGAASQGLKIEGRAGGVVVAPMKGTVRFGGEFKKYGKIVIIEHKNGYHSLIAGLQKIDTVVGQTVSPGEPVGSLGHSNGQEKPVLYYELRYKGKPVNPVTKFADLG